ncbi:MAG: T9SS type A sorting domain-containing protein [Rhodothermales bacterium]
MRTTTTLLLLLASFPLFRPALATDCAWTGGTGDWNVATNWSCGTVPGADDDVTVNTFDAVVTLNTAATIGALTFSRGTLTGSGALTVNGAFAWIDGGTLGAAVTVFGESTFSSQVSMRISGTLDLAGGATWSNGNINMTDGAVLLNRTGRTFTDSAVGSHSIARVSVTSTEPVVTNGGTWVTEGVGGTAMNVQFNNAGALVVNGGGLEFVSPGQLTQGNTATLRGTSVLDVDSGIAFTNAGSTQPGNGAGVPAVLSVRGDFPMTTNEHDLQIDLAGTAPGTGYDQLDVENGDVTVNGRLFLTFADGFVPTVGQTFAVLTHTGNGSVSGCYESEDIVVSPEAYEVAVVCTDEGIVAQVVAVTAGDPGAAPDALALSAAYPNPFRTSTALVLTAPAAQRVTVELFDALGRNVATLFDGAVAGGEVRTLALEAVALPSGLYVVRARGEGFTLTRRVTLLR